MDKFRLSSSVDSLFSITLALFKVKVCLWLVISREGVFFALLDRLIAVFGSMMLLYVALVDLVGPYGERMRC